MIGFRIATYMAYTQANDLEKLRRPPRRGPGEPAFIELTMMVAIENERSRFNSALGLTNQGSPSGASCRVTDALAIGAHGCGRGRLW